MRGGSLLQSELERLTRLSDISHAAAGVSPYGTAHDRKQVGQSQLAVFDCLRENSLLIVHGWCRQTRSQQIQPTHQLWDQYFCLISICVQNHRWLRHVVQASLHAWTK